MSGKYRRIDVRQLTAAIGAEVIGVEFGKAVDADIWHDIKTALQDHLMLSFRDQHLDAQSLLAIGRAFGDTGGMEVHEVFTPLAGHPEISVLENNAQKPPSNDYWHSDVTYRERPSMFTILYAETIPPIGGDTLWLSAHAAYAALAPPIKALLTGLTATHDILNAFGGHFLRQEGGKAAYRKAQDQYPPVEHPVVVTHPGSGKPLLFVNPSFTSDIVQVSRLESQHLLHMLYQHTVNPSWQVRHKWRKNDLVIWDNRATQHYATGDYFPSLRRMHRITVGGEKPVYRPTGESNA